MRRFVALVATSALLGCGSLHPYPNDLPLKNLHIRTATSTGSMFSSVRAELDVHSVDGGCQLRYLGTVSLDASDVAVGIAADRGSFLVFHFLSSNFLGSSRGRISREVFIRPRAEQHYEVDVSYRDDLYDVVVRERLARGTREVPLQDLRACRPAASLIPSARSG
jgi:hypothetical protein